MSNYYKEIQRATREADHIINEVLYIKEEVISLTNLELIQEPRFTCNFMKVFHKRLVLHMEGDKNIVMEDGLVKRIEWDLWIRT